MQTVELRSKPSESHRYHATELKWCYIRKYGVNSEEVGNLELSYWNAAVVDRVMELCRL